MKLILTFLIMLSLAMLKPVDKSDDFIEEFYNKCEQAYTNYTIYQEESNSTYTYIVVQGLINKTPCYGICYLNNDNDDYTFNISYGGVRYKFNNYDSNNNSYCIAIKSEEPIIGYITDKIGNESELFTLKVFFLNHFDINESFTGEGKGCEFNTFTMMKVRNKIIVQSIYTSLITLAIASIGIIIVFVIRKNKASNEKKQIGDIDMKDLYEQESEVVFKEEDYFDGLEEIEKIKKETKENYDDDNQSRVNIKEFLQNEGFITDYRVLSEDEKNQIMIKLMYLKDKGLITSDDYYKETKELWKK